MFAARPSDGMADHTGRRNGSEWQKICVTAEHNRLWQNDSKLLFNESTATQSYVRVLAGYDLPWAKPYT
jgi:hypothetical protein